MHEITVKDAFIKHDTPCVLGEASLYRPEDNTLHYLDIEAEPVSKLFIASLDTLGNLKSTRTVSIKGSRYVTSLAFRKDHPNSYIVGTSTGLAFLDEETGQITDEIALIEEDTDDMRMNDACIDSKGRIWANSLHKGGEKKGKLWSYLPAEGVREVESGFAIGNGPTFANGKMYFNVSSEGVSYVYDFDVENGKVSNRKTFFDNNLRSAKGILGSVLGEGTPDGMTADSAGNIYVADFGRACVQGFSPDGQQFLQINLPARCPTCPVFGGDNLRTLYVTTATEALLPGEQAILGDLGGNIFKVDLDAVLQAGVKGVVKHAFAG